MAMIPRITVLNNHDGYLTTIDNSRPESLHFSNDFLTLYHLNSASTFEATFNKVTNGKINPDAQHLINGNKLTMRYADDDYYFNIVDTDEDEFTIKVTALGAPLELTNAERDAYEANGNMTLEAYIKKFDFENIFHIRKNEIADRQKKLSLSSETMLQRLYTLGKEFNAEIKIVPILNDNHSLKELMLDIYKKDAGDQGIGTYRPEVRLRYGKNVSTIKRKISTINLKTAIKPIGNNDLNLIGYDMDIRDDKNQQLYYSTSASGYIYAPQAKAQFPSNLNGRNTSDFYAEYTKTFSTDSKAELAQLGLEDLKQMSQPQITYEVDAFYEGLKIGDTIRIDDNAYSPRLMLEARLTKMEICFTNPINNKLTFSNFIELKSEIDPLLIAKMQELADLNKVYNAQILTDNTVVFKNNEGETTLIARVLDGIKDITDKLTITWLKGDVEVGNGKNLRVRASDITGVETYRFNAFLNGKLIAQSQISVADVVDGVNGQPGRDGRDGRDGLPGKDGVGLKTTDVVYGLSNSESTQPTSWSAQVPTLTKGKFLWTKTVWTYTDNTSETGYQKTYIARDGNNGTDGIPGKDGVGIKTTTITYAASTSGTIRPTSGWSSQIPSVSSGQYLWTRTVWAYTDSTTETGYSVAKMGETGADGVDGQNAINAYLTNENVTLKADTQGNLKSGQLDLTRGQMVVVDGPTIVTSGVSYSIVNQTGCTATIDSSGNYRLTALNADSASMIFRASYKGAAFQKTFNVTKLLDAMPGKNGSDGADGKSPITGYLTNESLIITEGQWSKANGYFNVYQGTTQITNGVKFELVSQTDMTVAIEADSGFYQVTKCGDFGTAIFSATYNGVTIKKQLMAVMNKTGQAVVVSNTPPTTKTVGMLWKNTGTNEGLLTDVTYYWTGSKWEVYLFQAENIKVTNLAALSSNIGTVKTGMIMSSDGSMSIDLDKQKIHMKEYNHYGDEYYSPAHPGLKYQFWLTPTMFKYQHLEQPEQNGYYESGYADDGFYVADRSQMTKLVSHGVKFSDDLVLTASEITESSIDVTLPYNLKGKLYKRGRYVMLVIPRDSYNFYAPNGDYLWCSEEIPRSYAPMDEVAVTLHKYNGAYLIEPAVMHITSSGFIRITNSGYVSVDQYFAMSATATWISKY